VLSESGSDGRRASWEVRDDWAEIPEIDGQIAGAGAFGTAAFASVLRSSYRIETPAIVTLGADDMPEGALVAYVRNAKSERRGILSPPYGMTAKDDTSATRLLGAVRMYCRKNNLAFAEITSGTRPFTVPFATWKRTTVIKRLDPDPDTNWRAFRAKTRNLVRKAEKNGVVAEYGPARFCQFHKVYLERMTELGVTSHGFGYFEKLLAGLGHAVELYAACRQGRLLGGMVFIHTPTMSFYMYNASTAEGRSLGVNDFLMWQAFQDCLKRGVYIIDLGEATPGSPVFRFKTKEIGGVAETVVYYDATRSADLAEGALAVKYRPLSYRLGYQLAPYLPLAVRRTLLQRLKQYDRLV